MTRTRMRSTGLLLAAVLLLFGATGASAQDRTTRWDSAIDGVIRDAWQATGECVRMIRVMRRDCSRITSAWRRASSGRSSRRPRSWARAVIKGTGVRALPIRPGTGFLIVCVTAETDVRAVTGRDSVARANPGELVAGRIVRVFHTGFYRPTNPPMVTATRVIVRRRGGSDDDPGAESSHP